MSYTIKTFDGITATFTVADFNPNVPSLDNPADTTQVPVGLIRRDAIDYGQQFDQNLVNMLENFSSTSPAQLNSLKPLNGQIWFDQTTHRLRVNTGTQSSPVWELAAKPVLANSAPPALNGDLWYDTNLRQLNVFDASLHNFVTIGPLTTSLTLTGDVIGTSLGAILNATLAPLPSPPFTVNSVYTALTVDAAGRISAATNLTLQGDVTGTASGATLNATLASITTPGTYNTVNVDAAGRVTGGSLGSLLALDNTWTGSNAFAGQTSAPFIMLGNTGSGGTVTIDFTTGVNFSMTANGNFTLAAPINGVSGQAGTIQIVQDNVGGRTVTFGAGWIFAGGVKPTLSTGANAIDTISYQVFPGGQIAGSFNKGFS